MSSRAKGSKELDNLAPTVRRRNAILFKNESAFLHLDPKDRPIAKLHNQQWELYLDTVPIGYLHRTCANVKVNEPLPRQTICYLIKKYVQEHNVSVETLSSSIAAADEDIHKKGLVCRRPEDNKPVFNLQQLSDAGLYRVYTSIPNDHRPAEKTVVVRNRQPNKPPKKRRGRSLFTDKPFGVKKAAPVAQVTQVIPVRQPSFEENFTWVQCDACEKWRRLPDTDPASLPDYWVCSMHPWGATCADAEDDMDEDEWTVGAGSGEGVEGVGTVDDSSKSTGEGRISTRTRSKQRLG